MRAVAKSNLVIHEGGERKVVRRGSVVDVDKPERLEKRVEPYDPKRHGKVVNGVPEHALARLREEKGDARVSALREREGK